MAVRAVIASLMVGAAMSQSAPVAPSSNTGLCLPNQWSGGYTRTSDTSGATGNVTHWYHDQFFAIRENALGVGKSGNFESYQIEYIQNGTRTWAGIRWSDGSMNCYKTDNANPLFDKNCFEHGNTDSFHVNNRLARSAYNVIYPTNNRSHGVEVEVILASQSYPHLPIQSWTWDASSGQKRSPNYVMIHNPRLGFNKHISNIPAVCLKTLIEEGPIAEEAAVFFGKRAALKSEGGEWVHPKARRSPAPSNHMFSGYQLEEKAQMKTCVPNAYHSAFYYQSDNYTVTGMVAHNFAQKEFAVMENVSMNNPNFTLRFHFIQKGTQAWSLQQAKNGTWKCATASVQEHYNQRCFMGYRRHVVVNGHPATEFHMEDTTSGPNPVYSAFFQSRPSGLPISVLNLTDVKTGQNGDPKSISFFNTQFGAKHKLFKVPSSCSMDAEAQAEVVAAAKKYQRHLVAKFI